MPVPDDAATPVIPSPRDSRPAPLSRRSVLRGAASAGAAVLAVTVLAASPAFAASEHAHSSAANTSSPTSTSSPGNIGTADGEHAVRGAFPASGSLPMAWLRQRCPYSIVAVTAMSSDGPVMDFAASLRRFPLFSAHYE